MVFLEDDVDERVDGELGGKVQTGGGGAGRCDGRSWSCLCRFTSLSGCGGSLCPLEGRGEGRGDGRGVGRADGELGGDRLVMAVDAVATEAVRVWCAWSAPCGGDGVLPAVSSSAACVGSEPERAERCPVRVRRRLLNRK